MGRQQYMPKIIIKQKQNKSPEKELNEMEASNLPDTEFKKMVIRMLKEIGENFKEFIENYSSTKKDIETINKSQSEIKNTIYEMKNTLERTNNRLAEAEDHFTHLKVKVA